MTKSPIPIPNPRSQHMSPASTAGSCVRIRRCATTRCSAWRALFLLVVCLADRGLGWWCLMPALIGGVALLLHWSLGPPLVIVSLTGLLLSGARYRWGYPYWARNQVPTLMDLLLVRPCWPTSWGTIAFCLWCVTSFRRTLGGRSGGTSADPARRRSADRVEAWEMALLVLALPLWTGLAVVVWGWMMETCAGLGYAGQKLANAADGLGGPGGVGGDGLRGGILAADDGDAGGEPAVLAGSTLACDAAGARQSQSLAGLGAAARPAEEGKTMRYWWRELGGWLLIGLGLLCFLAVWHSARSITSWKRGRSRSLGLLSSGAASICSRWPSPRASASKPRIDSIPWRRKKNKSH